MPRRRWLSGGGGSIVDPRMVVLAFRGQADIEGLHSGVPVRDLMRRSCARCALLPSGRKLGAGSHCLSLVIMGCCVATRHEWKYPPPLPEFCLTT